MVLNKSCKDFVQNLQKFVTKLAPHQSIQIPLYFPVVHVLSNRKSKYLNFYLNDRGKCYGKTNLCKL